MRAAVVVFPGSNCDADTHWVLNEVAGIPADYVSPDEWDTAVPIEFLSIRRTPISVVDKAVLA